MPSNSEYGRKWRLLHPESSRQASRKWREGNPERTRENNRKRRVLARQIIDEHKRRHPCVDCGETDAALLQFDHRDRASKTFTVARYCSRGIESLRAEIAKCDMRCYKCHKKRTLTQQGAIRLKVSVSCESPQQPSLFMYLEAA